MLQCNAIFGCGAHLKRMDFPKAQLLKKANRLCKTCAAGNTLLSCGKCKGTYPQKTYATNQLRKGDSRQCKDCKQCGKCLRYMPSMLFSECAEQTPSYMSTFRKRRCNECSDEAKEKSKEQRKRDLDCCIFPAQSPKASKHT